MSFHIPRYFRHASLYSLGTILRSASSIFLLPLYTRYLTPADYGLIELVTVITGVIGTLVNFDLTNPIFRFYAEAQTREQKHRVIMSALLLTTIVNVAAALTMALAAPLLATHFLGGAQNAKYLVWISPWLLLEAWSAIPFCHMRADGQVGLFMSLSMVRLGIQIALNLYFLMALHLGPEALILANIISCATQAALSLVYSLRGGSLRVSKIAMRRLVSMGAPLALAGLATLCITFGDRFFLSKLNSLAAVGLYALAFRVSQAVNSLIYQPFLQVWEPEQFRLHGRKDLHVAFPLVFRTVFSGLTLAAFALALFIPEVLRVVATPPFYGAAGPLPFLLLSVLFSGMTDFCRVGSLVSSKTLNVTAGAIVGAVVAIGCFALLIPRLAAIGASIAMATAMLARLTFEYFKAKRYFDMHLQWTPIAVLLVAAACGLAVAQLWTTPMTLAGITAKSLILIAVAAPALLSLYRNFRSNPRHLEILRTLTGKPAAHAG